MSETKRFISDTLNLAQTEVTGNFDSKTAIESNLRSTASTSQLDRLTLNAPSSVNYIEFTIVEQNDAGALYTSMYYYPKKHTYLRVVNTLVETPKGTTNEISAVHIINTLSNRKTVISSSDIGTGKIFLDTKGANVNDLIQFLLLNTAI